MSIKITFLGVGLLSVVGLIAQTDDITIPLDDGSILISAQFIHENYVHLYVPELVLKLTNRTSSSWNTLKLQFDIGGLCNGQPRQWTIPVVTSLGWLEDHQIVKDYSDYVIPLVGKVDGCTSEIIKARLVLAENQNVHIDGISGERVDLQKQRQEIEAKQKIDAAEEAEDKRQIAEEERQAAQAKVNDARLVEELEARKDAKRSALEAAHVRLLRKRLAVACNSVYQNTIDKKVTDLTVREAEVVKKCQDVGMYPPN
jgi:hypothetical protein